MEYKAVSIPDSELKEILPLGVYHSMQTTEYVIFAAIEKESVKAIMVICDSGKNGEVEIMHLDYIEDDIQKAHEICKNLIIAGKTAVFDMGVRSIYTWWGDTESKQKRVMKLMAECGFMPLSLSGVAYEYSLDNVSNLDSIKKLAKTKNSLCKYICSLENDSSLLKKFYLDLDYYGMSFEKEQYNSDLSRFFILNGEIRACILGVKAAQKVLYIPILYTDGSDIASAALVTMMAEVFEQASMVFPKRSIILIESHDIDTEKGMFKLLKSPDAEYQVHEYVCINKKSS